MNVTVKIIPHKKQRYDTVGDWFYDTQGNLQIRVSKMSNGLYEQLVEIHERIEVALCEAVNITQEDVDEFDLWFESNRKPNDISEPGDSTLAPYHKQHLIATAIERLLAVELGVNWSEYEKEVNNLCY